MPEASVRFGLSWLGGARASSLLKVPRWLQGAGALGSLRPHWEWGENPGAPGRSVAGAGPTTCTSDASAVRGVCPEECGMPYNRGQAGPGEGAGF